MRLKNLPFLAILLSFSTALVSYIGHVAEIPGQASNASAQEAPMLQQQASGDGKGDLNLSSHAEVVPKISNHDMQPVPFDASAPAPMRVAQQPKPPVPAAPAPPQVALEGNNQLAQPAPQLLVPGIDGRSIDGFRAKLAALEAGRLNRPITILHIGDSHIADDSFTRGIRSRLQARFGNAGRGAVIPANAFEHANEAGVQLAASAGWNGSMSLHNGDGVYGVSGVRVDGASPSAVMKLSADTEFDHASVTAATGPSQGGFTVSVNGKAYHFSTQSPQTGAKTFEIAVQGSALEIHPDGNGDVALLNWSTTRDEPGVRYVNFGQIGATVRVTQRWNAAAVANDVRAIKPDLIVYGFGTNEGFDGNTDLGAYRKTANDFINTLKASAPDAAIAIIGASDSLKRGGSGCGAGWGSPPKLAGVRDTMKSVAQEIGAFYWDWSAAMGGACSMTRWAALGLGSPDHIHLTPKGYEVSADKFTAALLGPLGSKPYSVAVQ